MTASSCVSVVHGQPNCRLIRRRPINPVLLVVPDADEVAGLHLDGLVLETKSGRSLQHDDSFVLLLLVPESFGRGMAMGDDSLDADVDIFEQRGEKLVGQFGWKIS